MQSVKIFLTQFIYAVKRVSVLFLTDLKMKKFLILVLSFWLCANQAVALNLVEEESYFDVPLEVTGLPDYPPFSRYIQAEQNTAVLESAFLKPMIDVMKKYKMEIYPEKISNAETDVKMLILGVRSGKVKLFIGAYSDTQLYKGLQMIFPASISNPIHLITIPDNQGKISNVADLASLRGVASKTEYFSDFVNRKLQDLNVQFTDTPFEAYRKVILGEADYMIGSMYYNRMMLSHYGLSDFLVYSHNPIFKIPVFIAISKVTPRLSQYLNAFRAEFSKPEFSHAVKQEIIRLIEEEIAKYDGTVPPSFVPQSADDEHNIFEDEPEEENTKQPIGHIIEQEEKQEKSVDEVLEGI